MRYGARGWAGLAAHIAVVELLAPPGETLSETVDDWMSRHSGRVLWFALVGVVAAHLLNLLPERVDPIHRIFVKNASVPEVFGTHAIRL